MIFLLIILALVLATFLMARGHKRSALTSLVLALVAVVGFGSGPFARALVEPLQAPFAATDVPKTWAPHSAIVVLGMGNAQINGKRSEPNPLAFGRVRMAAVAYLACKKAGSRCTVIFTGGAEAVRGIAEARTYADEAIRLGVPVSDVLIEDRSRNTWENAKFTRPILAKLGADKIYLVTSGIHLSRSLLYFGHHGIHATPIRPDYLLPLPGLLPQAYNIGVADLALGEYKGFLQYRLYNMLGKNDPPSPALIAAPITR